jgi:hypothetical protein
MYYYENVSCRCYIWECEIIIKFCCVGIGLLFSTGGVLWNGLSVNNGNPFELQVANFCNVVKSCHLQTLLRAFLTVERSSIQTIPLLITATMSYIALVPFSDKSKNYCYWMRCSYFSEMIYSNKYIIYCNKYINRNLS